MVGLREPQGPKVQISVFPLRRHIFSFMYAHSILEARVFHCIPRILPTIVRGVPGLPTFSHCIHFALSVSREVKYMLM